MSDESDDQNESHQDYSRGNFRQAQPKSHHAVRIEKKCDCKNATPHELHAHLIVQMHPVIDLSELRVKNRPRGCNCSDCEVKTACTIGILLMIGTFCAIAYGIYVSVTGGHI